MTVFLCGFMGCGKSTVGKLLAKKMGFCFYDTDELIVEEQNMSIPDIFAQKGEPYFREVEARIVKSMCGKSAIVACGGGAMLNADTAAAANENGIVVFIDVPFEVCYERICNDSNRPIAASSNKEQLLERYSSRYGIYSAHSAFTVDGSGSPMEIADKITEYIAK